jgi:hypothetical protein
MPVHASCWAPAWQPSCAGRSASWRARPPTPGRLAMQPPSRGAPWPQCLLGPCCCATCTGAHSRCSCRSCSRWGGGRVRWWLGRGQLPRARALAAAGRARAHPRLGCRAWACRPLKRGRYKLPCWPHTWRASCRVGCWQIGLGAPGGRACPARRSCSDHALSRLCCPLCGRAARPPPGPRGASLPQQTSSQQLAGRLAGCRWSPTRQAARTTGPWLQQPPGAGRPDAPQPAPPLLAGCSWSDSCSGRWPQPAWRLPQAWSRCWQPAWSWAWRLLASCLALQVRHAVPAQQLGRGVFL